MTKRLMHMMLRSLLGLLVYVACAEEIGEAIEDRSLFQEVEVPVDEQIKKDDILSNIVSESLPRIQETIKAADARDKTLFDKGVDLADETSRRAIEIGSSGKLFTELTKFVVQKLEISPQTIEQQLSRPLKRMSIDCPFLKLPDCEEAATSRYRTIDGSCNNLKHTLWGRSLTPFERMMPAVYDNGVDEPRHTSVSKEQLPLARVISSRFHQSSLLSHLMPDLSHMAMEFGQFLSHDIQRNALSTGYGQVNIDTDCCENGIPRSGDPCFPIEIPTDDLYYSKVKRTCMHFVRALPTPKLDCSLGQRQQLNLNTHYIDGSQIYGSDAETSNTLRLFTGGKLQTGEDPNIPNLLPKDNDNAANCILPEPNPNNVACFLAGDSRVNQQPALISLHTIFMREHNRIAEGLEALHNGWSDQIIYDEARKIIGAMLQHITYKEYLPEILGEDIMNSYDLQPLTSGFFTGYNITVNAAIKNEFSAAAFRFGHSMVHDSLKYSCDHLLFKDVFFNPATLYDATEGIDSITKGLMDSYSQKVDEYLSSQLTSHLFERKKGFGDDLAAINIQRGRDHGIPPYEQIKKVCEVSGKLHDSSVWEELIKIYKDPADIDLYPAGVSENPVTGGKIGQTFACIIAKQFEALKKGDRYYYENSGDQAFTLEQLDEIRNTTLSKVICRNTGICSIPSNAFRVKSNPIMHCRDVSAIDYSKWRTKDVKRGNEIQADIQSFD